MEDVGAALVGHGVLDRGIRPILVESDLPSRPWGEPGRVVVAVEVLEDRAADAVRDGEAGDRRPGPADAGGVDGGHAPVEGAERPADERVKVGNAAASEEVGAGRVAAELDVIARRARDGIP